MEAIGISDGGGADDGTNSDAAGDDGASGAALGAPGAAVGGAGDAGLAVGAAVGAAGAVGLVPDGGDSCIRASWSSSPAVMVSPGTFGGIRLISGLLLINMLTSIGWPAPWATLGAFPGAGGVPDPPAG